jgi:hypothetical protein
MAKKAVPAKPAPGGKAVQFGQVTIPLHEPVHVDVAVADLITEAREFSGTVALGFATLVVDGSAPVEARTCARIRLTLAGAGDLRNILDNILKGTMPPKGETH